MMDGLVENKGSINAQIFGLLREQTKQLGTIEGDVKVIKADMGHKVDEVDMRDFVDDRIKEHAAPEPTGQTQTPRGNDSGTIRINVAGLSPVIRWFLYIAIPALAGLGGHTVAGQ